MENYLIWLILGLVLLGVEMMIGSIYLLALVAGCAIACIFAFMGTSFTTQCIVASDAISEKSLLPIRIVTILIRDRLLTSRKSIPTEVPPLTTVEHSGRHMPVKAHWRLESTTSRRLMVPD